MGFPHSSDPSAPVDVFAELTGAAEARLRAVPDYALEAVNVEIRGRWPGLAFTTVLSPMAAIALSEALLSAVVELRRDAILLRRRVGSQS